MTEIYNLLGRIWNRRLIMIYILFSLLVFFGIDFINNWMKGPLKYLVIIVGLFSLYILYKKNL